MKVQISTKLKGIKGEPINDNGQVLTLKDIVINGVLSPVDGDDEKKKWEKYEIFKKVRDAKDVADLTAEEITVIKKCIAKMSPPLIMGQAFEIIEGK